MELHLVCEFERGNFGLTEELELKWTAVASLQLQLQNVILFIVLNFKIKFLFPLGVIVHSIFWQSIEFLFVDVELNK